jgi:predicted RNase H-like HicB family nuclease
MEKIINLQIEKLPEGYYLATSEDLPGLVAQGKTLSETIEIAQDVAQKLLEAMAQRNQFYSLSSLKDSFEYPLLIRQ